MSKSKTPNAPPPSLFESLAVAAPKKQGEGDVGHAEGDEKDEPAAPSAAPRTAPSAAPQAHIWSVGELGAAVRASLERGFGDIRLRGEIASLARPASGHLYCNLRDGKASIDAVLWRGKGGAVRAALAEGQEVIVRGRVSAFAQRSKYQFIIEEIELAGQGALLLQLEQLRNRLEREGLFAPETKRDLPPFPAVVGVITSPTGAVIRDILHAFALRFPVRVLLWSVRVQGEHAAGEVAEAIRGFDRLPRAGVPRPDVLIVARGGGSLEDLMPFNDERVVRAAAACRIPLVSAVGHETDTGLLDYAADLRAPTPSAAAARVVQERRVLLEGVRADGARLGSALVRRTREARRRFEPSAARLARPETALEAPRRALDEAGRALARALETHLERKRTQLRHLRPPAPAPRVRAARALLDAHAARLGRPRKVLEAPRRTLDAHAARLGHAAQIYPTRARARLEGAARLLRGLGYENVLERGFAIPRNAQGRILRRAEEFPCGAPFRLLLAGGAEIDAERKAGETTGGEGDD